MVKFENYEKWDMIIAYIESGKNVSDAANLYFTRYPERRQPNRVIFSKLSNNLKNYGSFVKPRPKKYAKPNKENETINVLGFVEVNSSSSSREIEGEIGVPRRTALRILKDNKYKPYKIRINHYLYPNDNQKRLQFCRWYLQKCEEVNSFRNNIIWTDEAKITSDGLFNRNNQHIWSDINPNANTTRKRQGRYGFNVCCFMMQNKIYYFTYEDNLNANLYLELLENHLAEFLDSIPLQTRQNIFFQLDGAPAHNAMVTRNFLNHTFPNNWIGTYGPVNWPPRSPDITPLDFFLWGFLKDQVYSKENNNMEELRRNTASAFEKIKPVHVINALRAIEKRCQLCIQNNGGHFEHKL